MMNSYLKTIQIISTLMISLALMACNNAIFSSKGVSNNKVTSAAVTPQAVTPQAVTDYVFIDDSFERDDIFMDLVNNAIYGWRGFVLDGTTPVIGFQSNGAGSSIPAVGTFGPAADGNRFLLMQGRTNGAPVETLQIVTRSYDLSQYNTAIISFKYITFGLNDATDTVPETLQLQVCRGSLNECGANDDVLDANGLMGNKWVTVFSSDPTFNDQALNGKNHTVADWRTGIAVVDLNDPNFVGYSSTFVMRFVGVMKDGLKLGTPGTVADDSDPCS
jgi:hypothetical protein